MHAKRRFWLPSFKNKAGGHRSHIQKTCPLHISSEPCVHYKNVYYTPVFTRQHAEKWFQSPKFRFSQGYSGRSKVTCTEYMSTISTEPLVCILKIVHWCLPTQHNMKNKGFSHHIPMSRSWGGQRSSVYVYNLCLHHCISSALV